MSIDAEITARLAKIAEKLETRAGFEADAALKRDMTITARLRRIADAIQEGGLDLSHGDLFGLDDDDHEQYLLADGSRPVTGTLDITETCDDELSKGWNGAILETAVVSVTSDGITITFSLTGEAGVTTLTTRFGGQSYSIAVDSAVTIALAVGTDTVPVQSWIWLSESSGIISLNTGTAGWPSIPHCPLAIVLCQSAASLQIDGALKIHAWTDHIDKATENGHISHISRKIRRLAANWDSGIEGQDMVVSDPNAYLSCNSGFVFQLHNHSFPALDMQAGDPIYIVNHFVTAYLRSTTLNDINTDAFGNTVNNKYINLVLWASVNEDETDCKLYLNVPNGTYNTASTAIADALNYSVYDIPDEFQGTGFLIARYVVQGKTSGAWSQSDKIDLRGQLAPTSAGGTGTGATILDDLGDVTLSGPVVTEILRHDGTDWKNAALALGDLPAIELDDLSNVMLMNPQDAHVLMFTDPNTWFNKILLLDDLGDVFLATPTAGDTLVYTGAVFTDTPFEIQWLNDTNISSPADDEFLRHNGTKWVNEAVSLVATLDDLSDVTIAGLADKDVLIYDSGGGAVFKNEPKETLIRADGTIPLTGDWDAGAFEVEALTLLATYDVDDTAADALSAVVNVQDTSSGGGRIYRGLFIDLDYDYDNAGGLDTNTPRALEIDMDVITTNTIFSVTKPQAIRVSITNDANTAYGTAAADVPISFQIINAKASQAFAEGAMNIQLDAGASSGSCLGTRSVVRGSGTGFLTAYQGYILGEGNPTGKAVALSAFVSARATMSQIIGVESLPRALGAFPDKDVCMAYRGDNGHWLASRASLFVTSTLRANPSTFATTHLTHTNYEGAGYFEGLLEVDDVIFADGGITMAAATMLTIGVYADGTRGAAGTAGRVIFNTTDGNLNIDDGTNWILPDGSTT